MAEKLAAKTDKGEDVAVEKLDDKEAPAEEPVPLSEIEGTAEWDWAQKQKELDKQNRRQERENKADVKEQEAAAEENAEQQLTQEEISAGVSKSGDTAETDPASVKGDSDAAGAGEGGN